VRFSAEEVIEVLKLSPLPPVPPNPRNAVADRPDAARLGRLLFFETRLSGNGRVSCASCHQPAGDWTDGKPVSEGIGRLRRNTPTLWNVAHNRWQYWDGRRDSLWAQALVPIEMDLEMGGSRLRVWRVISEPGPLRAAYERVFGPIPILAGLPEAQDARPISERRQHAHQAAWNRIPEETREQINRLFSNGGKALEAYERRIISDAAPFDRFVAGVRAGDRAAMESLPAAAVRGLRFFIGRGQCLLCHSGPNFSDREFHNLGLDRGTQLLDVGRFAGVEGVHADVFNGLGRYSDDRSLAANTPLAYAAPKPNNLGEFKTPTLRNVARTAPYMHDGRFAELRHVLDFYSRLDQQPALGHREESLKPLLLSEEETADLLVFLESLSGPPADAALLPGEER
jgi:cytochrome c peroxidase